MKFANNSTITDPVTKYPEHEKLRNCSDDCVALTNFFLWLVKQNIIQSKFFVYDAFPPNGETEDQIILRYLGISTEKLDEEKRAMGIAFQKMAAFAQYYEDESSADLTSGPLQKEQQHDSPPLERKAPPEEERNLAHQPGPVREEDDSEDASGKGTFAVREDRKDI
jgi:hypothetical protein